MKAFYFPHDDNAAGDERILKLRAKFGNTEGYAMWFMLLEYLSRNGGYIDGYAMAELSLCYSIAAEKWRPFVDVCTDIGLLHTSKKGLFSPRMVDALNLRKERSESGTKGAKSRWSSEKKDDGTAIGKPMAQPLAGEESIEEKRIEIKKPTKKALENNEKPTRTERPDTEVIKTFFDMAQNEQWSEHTYTDAKTKQFYELSKDDKEDVLKKMRVANNAFFSKSESTKKLSKKIYHETVGLIQDRALDRKTIDGKTIAKRREFAEEENGKRYVEEELNPPPF